MLVCLEKIWILLESGKSDRVRELYYHDYKPEILILIFKLQSILGLYIIQIFNIIQICIEK